MPSCDSAFSAESAASVQLSLDVGVPIWSVADGADGDGDDCANDGGSDADGDGTESTYWSRLAKSISMTKHQETWTIYWPKLPHTQSSHSQMIPLEIVLILMLGSLKCS